MLEGTHALPRTSSRWSSPTPHPRAIIPNFLPYCPDSRWGGGERVLGGVAGQESNPSTTASQPPASQDPITLTPQHPAPQHLRTQATSILVSPHPSIPAPQPPSPPASHHPRPNLFFNTSPRLKVLPAAAFLSMQTADSKNARFLHLGRKKRSGRSSGKANR